MYTPDDRLKLMAVIRRNALWQRALRDELMILSEFTRITVERSRRLRTGVQTEQIQY